MKVKKLGPPQLDVSKDDLESPRALKFSWTKIARMLGISRQTLYRRLEEYGIPCSDYSVMIPSDLDRAVNRSIGETRHSCYSLSTKIINSSG